MARPSFLKWSKTFVLLAGISAGSSASAAEWHFCLAAAHPERRIYMTDPFVSTAKLDEMEGAFASALVALQVSFDNVQCPRADNELNAVEMRAHAEAFNKSYGTKTFRVDWSPATPTARLGGALK